MCVNTDLLRHGLCIVSTCFVLSGPEHKQIICLLRWINTERHLFAQLWQDIQSCIRSAQADKEGSKHLKIAEQSSTSTNTTAMALLSMEAYPRTTQPLPLR